jgi:hypothetical protein
MDPEQQAVHDGALKILNQVQQMWGKEHSFSLADEKSFRHLDLGFYRKIENQLQQLGFTTLGDIEDISIKETKPDPRTFIRILINFGETISAAVYHAKPKFPWPLLCWFFKITPLKIFEFETEFENGTILTTTIASAKTRTDGPKEFIKQYCGRKSIPPEVLQKHSYKMGEIIAEQRTRPKRTPTLDDICASQNRAINLKRKHMEENGWVSKEYLIRQHGKDDKFINDVYEEVQRLVRKQLITGSID